MDIKLDAQFVRDYEELRKASTASEEIKKYQEEVERLKGVIQEKLREPSTGSVEIQRLQKEVERLKGVIQEMEDRLLKETERGNAELRKLQAQFTGQLEELKRSHNEQLAQKEKELEEVRAEQVRKEREVRQAMKAELAKRTKAFADEAQQNIATAKDEMGSLLMGRIEGSLARLAYVPLSMRLSGLALDVLLLALTGAALRFGTEWGHVVPDATFILGMVVVFSLRTFVSPGNLLLGISARHIGPHHRPEGRVSLRARLLCGLLHYGPLIATAVVAVTDEPTAAGLKKLVNWAFHLGSTGQTLPALVTELLRPDKPGLPGVILTVTLVWWVLLVLSILFSSLMHWGTPYFRNTTLVEYLERVGFRRFAPPALNSSEPDLVNGSG